MASIPPPRKYAQVIEPGQTDERFTPVDKVIFSFTEIARPITLIPALYSASYEQLFQTDPKYGNDSAAFGQKIGAALLRRATLRVYSDGIFASAFHQDPRYYVQGPQRPFIHRVLYAATRPIIGRTDGGRTTVMLNVYVHDVDAHYAHAVAEGATITMELDDAFFGERRSG